MQKVCVLHALRWELAARIVMSRLSRIMMATTPSSSHHCMQLNIIRILEITSPNSPSQWSAYGSEVHQHLLLHGQILARHFAARLVVFSGFRVALDVRPNNSVGKRLREWPAKIDFMIQWNNCVMSVEISDPRDIAATYYESRRRWRLCQ
jgi:hypothetical protein